MCELSVCRCYIILSCYHTGKEFRQRQGLTINFKAFPTFRIQKEVQTVSKETQEEDSISETKPRKGSVRKESEQIQKVRSHHQGIKKT